MGSAAQTREVEGMKFITCRVDNKLNERREFITQAEVYKIDFAKFNL